MDDVGAAILLAQAVVGRPGVEDQRALILGGVGDLEKRVGRQIDDQVAHALVEERLRRRERVVVRGELDVLDREGLVEEFAGRVVVGHRHLGAGDKVVGGGNIDDRDRLPRMLDPEDADLDLERDRPSRRRAAAESVSKASAQGAMLESVALAEFDAMISAPGAGAAA